MKPNNRNSGNGNQQKTAVKQQQVDQPQKTNNPSGKKPVYIKDMPPIDGARPGVI
ncbi:hypothetical protein [Mucilaginibacter sp. UR6-11]|uniref:hypothetical protein n=1 Tax=Mucilaginibacter sp. UR6-11 TaxID=1435644 RepID=UPI001E4C48AA|nr:hypothetical protein [Mucilaginibacter sp. UR6-11]MCC8425531.1 hypothetical protein [Mucilaginibacter sp. UR6-11]